MGKPKSLPLPGVPPKVKNPVRIAAGKRSKAKGGSFERYVVDEFKKQGVEAKRGWWQTGLHATSNRFRKVDPNIPKVRVPDVLVDGLWIEASSGASSGLESTKLLQAKKYVESTDGKNVVPVAIVRKKGSRVVYATLVVEDMMHLFGVGSCPLRFEGTMCSLELGDFISVYRMWRERLAGERHPTPKEPDMFAADWDEEKK